MKRWALMVLAAVVALGLVLVWAQQNWDDVQIETVAVAGPVHMLVGRGGNIGVTAGEDGILIVDDQFAPLADKIRAALQALNPGDLKFVLNTHYHGDHTGGNAAFGPEATIVAHTNVRKRLQSPSSGPAYPPAAWPVITFDHSVSIHFNGEEIRVIHLPKGHTDGDSVIHFTGSNVFHLGDHFFRDLFPYVDVPSGGNAVGYMENVAKLIETIPADAKIIPGHGDLANLEDLKRFHAMLEETIAAVRARKESGMSLEQAQKEGMPEKYAAWVWSFISANRWIEIVYSSL